jgi:hypothetical protein
VTTNFEITVSYTLLIWQPILKSPTPFLKTGGFNAKKILNISNDTLLVESIWLSVTEYDSCLLGSKVSKSIREKKKNTIKSIDTLKDFIA